MSLSIEYIGTFQTTVCIGHLVKLLDICIKETYVFEIQIEPFYHLEACLEVYTDRMS